MTSIGRLATRFGLSRSTLLYYDKIGLLRPSARTFSGYRVYSDIDAGRLETICMYRDTGLSLGVIGNILDGPESKLRSSLQIRRDELASEITRLQTQQKLIAGLLKCKLPAANGLTKEIWTGLLAASGFEKQDMIDWHVAFEKSAPEKHKSFLEILNIPASEIRTIRRWAKI